MFDPLGAFERIIDQFIAYVETAYRVDDPAFSAKRRELLKQPGNLSLAPIFEAVLRYQSCEKGLEELVFDEDVLPGFSPWARKTFAELALSGLFDRDQSKMYEQPVRFRSQYKPYRHQIEMLRKGVVDGQPGVVTSGTGSGKTEAFMLPVIAQIVRESERWPEHLGGYETTWHAPKKRFELHRRNESNKRPKAVRAMILYPLNALVEDQMVRLRKSLDSPDAREVMDRHMGGNRIFFGRYTGKTPVTGFNVHPRLGDDPQWRKRRSKRVAELKGEIKKFANLQTRISDDDSDDPELRYLFPSVDGAELISRWDIQETPPDILVTNQSILNAILVREVDEPIIRKTREWLKSEPDARFHLVLDELHLARGSAGAELAGLLQVLFEKLGLNHSDRRHKLRIHASSASLPVDDHANAEASVSYLNSMFGNAGINSKDVNKGASESWRAAIVSGDLAEVSTRREPLDPLLFEQLGISLDQLSVQHEGSVSNFHECLERACDTLVSDPSTNSSDLANHAISSASSVLLGALEGSSGSFQTVEADKVAMRIFGIGNQTALRGLTIIRAMAELPDRLTHPSLIPDKPAARALPSLRVHAFIRNLEGVFASLKANADGVEWGTPTIERGESFDVRAGNDGLMPRRVFEMLYCEACGELYVGGRRGGSPEAKTILLPAPDDLELMPEKSQALRFEDAGADEFALFWPKTDKANVDGSKNSPYNWTRAYLDPYTGMVATQVTDEAIAGYLLYRKQGTDVHGRERESDGTAVPYCCARCGTDYFRRFRAKNSARSGGRLSPIRTFRTGFGKTSQLLATELISALKSQGSSAVSGKLIAFSDSREDAAKLAFDVEVDHQRDLRREILLLEAEAAKGSSGVKPDDQLRDAELRSRVPELISQNSFEELSEILAELDQIKIRREQKDLDPSIAISDLFEVRRDQNDSRVRAMVAKLLSLGTTPLEGADVVSNRVAKKPWFEFFNDVCTEWLDGNDEHLKNVERAKIKLLDGQAVEATDVLFNKTYFAFEETGLGYPSFYPTGTYGEVEQRDDAWLRIFSDSYRIDPDKFSNQNSSRPVWHDAASAMGGPNTRVSVLLVRIFGDLQKAQSALDNFLSRQRASKKIEPDATIDVTRLHFRTVRDDAPSYRCEKCSRVHLHRGLGSCTRCGEKLPEPKMNAGEVSSQNALGRKVKRALAGNEDLFRIKCEELTGQTQDPALRLQQFKGVFVRTQNESNGHFEARKKFDEADMLSVTTTMEVGVDIGSLEAIYQANMPPQRFNYQQRVGRAGRRGQAFPAVLTVCRSKSHDLHYFRNPVEMTGKPPPAPFVTTSLPDIPSRLLRKFWLVEAFKSLRDQAGTSWPGDDLVPGDIHGEFLSCMEYFGDDSDWPNQLNRALNTTISYRDCLAAILSGISKCDVDMLKVTVTADAVLKNIASLETQHKDERIGIASALSEQGLIPLYGMPTRTRNLYTDITVTGRAFEARGQWDVVGRDQDMAIFDFAPGNVRTKEKEHHLCVGLTGELPEPKGSDDGPALNPFSQWYRAIFELVHCENCRQWSRVENGEANCPKCHTALDSKRHLSVVPAGFRTLLRPLGDEVPLSVRGQRLTLAGIGRPDANPDGIRVNGNLEVTFGERAEVFVVNAGRFGESGPEGYDLQECTDTLPSAFNENFALRFPGSSRRSIQISNQAVSANEIGERPARFNVSVDASPSNYWLVSPKTTNSLQVRAKSVSPKLRIGDFESGTDFVDRDKGLTSIRAAASSATEILVQKASRELDISPEEFDVLSPYCASIDGIQTPVLQIADALANGSGFCRHLLTDARLAVDGLVKSIVGDPGAWPLQDVTEGEHPKQCDTSCYRCIQRYSNSNLHGLLDWRLGIGFLRCVSDSDHQCGLDGDWSAPELADWRLHARNYSMRAARISGTRATEDSGPLKLPTVILQNGRRGVFVHPFWKLSVVGEEIGLRDGDVTIDTFEFARRPMQSVQVK